ncbi:Uma2 family endonuclease [Planktothrix agardhii]|uniref:Uma2 family endonuclease n=2 Tax=Planktothrix agardhii TaxID=1160 RepID=UPI0039B0AEC6
METNILTLPPILKLKLDLTSEQFWQLCQENHDFRFERTNSGELIIMPPTGGNTGKRNVKITTQIDLWNSKTRLGEVFDSNTGFTLPNGAFIVCIKMWKSWHTLIKFQARIFCPVLYWI